MEGGMSRRYSRSLLGRVCRPRRSPAGPLTPLHPQHSTTPPPPGSSHSTPTSLAWVHAAGAAEKVQPLRVASPASQPTAVIAIPRPGLLP